MEQADKALSGMDGMGGYIDSGKPSNPGGIFGKQMKEDKKEGEEDDESSYDDEDDGRDYYKGLLPEGDAPELEIELVMVKREAAKEPQFKFYRNLYYGEIADIENSYLQAFTDKGW